MKSFPSTFTKNPLVQTKGVASGNIKQTLKNMAGALMNNVLNGENAGAVTKDQLSENVEWVEFNYDELINNANISNKYVLKKPSAQLNRTFYGENDKISKHENAFKIPASVLSSVNRYRFVFKETAIYQEEIEKSKDKQHRMVFRAEQGIAPSLFNPLFGINVSGVTHAVPLIHIGQENSLQEIKVGSYDEAGKPIQPKKDGEYKNDFSGANIPTEEISVQLNDLRTNWTDCSIKKLVDLSGGHGSNRGETLDSKESLGRAKYRYADFMYCKDLGKVSNNHLITLRKFAAPVGDNIFKLPDSKKKDNWEQPDVARLVTWFGTDDNKLEDICKYNYKSTWKPLQAQIEDVNSKEDDNRPLTSLVNAANPEYWKALSRGTAGGGNNMFQWVAQKSGVMEAHGTYQSDSDYYYLDKNKVWEPKNTVQSNHIYEGKLEFNQEFTLTFSYKLRGYDGINPRSAFMDLLGNILEVTYRRGTFWGGQRRFLGPPRNSAGWKKANEILDKMETGLETGISEIFGALGSEDILGSLSNVWQNFGNYLGNMVEAAKTAVNNFIDGGGIQNAMNGIKDNAGLIAGGMMGMLKNKLGRPAVYAINSLVPGDPTGYWHLTVGNPRNPILAMGNLILTNSEIRHSGPLGIDDFPTELTVIITLKHAKPRDLTEISQMYTAGQGGIYLPLKEKQLSKYFKDITYQAPEDISVMSYIAKEYTYKDKDGKEQKISYFEGQSINEKHEVVGTPTEVSKTVKTASDKPVTKDLRSPDILNLGWALSENISSKEWDYHTRNS